MCVCCFQITADIVESVKKHMGSFVCLKQVATVTALPKTRSGKVVRGTIQKMADSRAYRVPATLENAAVLADVRHALRAIGYAHQDARIQ